MMMEANMVQSGLGDIFSSIAKGSGAVATTAGTAASVLTTGSGAAATIFGSAAAAQIVPVVGQIAGAVAVIAGFIVMQKAKSKALKSSLADVEEQRLDLIRQNNELDNMILDAGEQARQIFAQVRQVLGLNGLGGTSDRDVDSLIVEIEGKLSRLETIQRQLETLGTKVLRTYGLAGMGDVDAITTVMDDKLSKLEDVQKSLEKLAADLMEAATPVSDKQIALTSCGVIAVGVGLYFLFKFLGKPKKTHISDRPDRRSKKQ